MSFYYNRKKASAFIMDESRSFLFMVLYQSLQWDSPESHSFTMRKSHFDVCYL